MVEKPSSQREPNGVAQHFIIPILLASLPIAVAGIVCMGQGGVMPGRVLLGLAWVVALCALVFARGITRRQLLVVCVGYGIALGIVSYLGPSMSGHTTPPAVVSPQAPPALPMMKEAVSIAETRRIPSPYDDAQEGLEILFHTTVPLQPIYLNIEFAEPIQHVEVFPTEDFTGTYPYGAGTVPGAPNIAAVSMTAPAFTPEHAMVVRVYSKSTNHVLGFDYEAGHPR